MENVKIKPSFKMNLGIDNIAENLMPSKRTPLFFSSEWRKRALPCCCSVLLDISLSGGDVSGSSWGGPALAPLKGRSATLCASASTGAPSLWDTENVFPGQVWKWMLQSYFHTKIQMQKYSTLQSSWAQDRWSLHIFLSCKVNNCKHWMKNLPSDTLTQIDVILGFL